MAPPYKVPGPAIPLVYQLFFLWIEPFSTAVGAYYAHFSQPAYMTMTAAPLTIPPPPVTTTTSIVLTQLANLYFVFALNEALVLRSTNDLTVWRAFLFGLLVADFGHLFSVHQVGVEVYWEFWKWNAMYWGNLGFVYVGAAIRTAFLLGVGLNRGGVKSKTKR